MFETAAVMIAEIFVLMWAVMEGRHYILVPGSIGGLVSRVYSRLFHSHFFGAYCANQNPPQVKILLLPDTLLLRIKCHCIYLVP